MTTVAPPALPPSLPAPRPSPRGTATSAVRSVSSRSVRNGWTAARRRALVDYLAGLMATLRLADWQLTVDLSVDASVDALAEISWTCGSTATMWLSAGFLDLPPAVQRDTLLHELLHLHLNPLADLSAAMLDGGMDPAAAAMHGRALAHDLEARVDVLAGAFGALLAPPALGAA